VPSGGPRRPSRNSIQAQEVQDFRRHIEVALSEADDQGRRWAAAQWGCYAFYDYDGEPIYVGQTNERLRVRVGAASHEPADGPGGDAYP
jgi:hypothetical protein